MRIRRPLAGLFVALTLFGGGGTALAGCGNPVDSGTGTPADSSTTAHSNPDNPSQGNLPNDSNQKPGAHTSCAGGVGGSQG
jgi:hypothetical protein